MRRSPSFSIASVLVGVLVSSQILCGQQEDLFLGLASADPAVRNKSSKILSRKGPGDWLLKGLDRARFAPAEVRQRFLEALARNRALFPVLIQEFARGGTTRRDLMRGCLLAAFAHNTLPSPADPSLVEVLPTVPMSLVGVRDLQELWDRMLVAGSFGLPCILDPRLDREGAIGRQSLARLTGAYGLRELLPPLERPGWAGRSEGLLTRIRPECVFVTSASGPKTSAGFFLMCLEQYLGADEPGGQRAALCLAAMDLEGMGEFFVQDSVGRRKSRALLGLVGEELRGRTWLSADRLGPSLLAFYRKSQRWRYLIGSGLRELLVDRGELAPWYGKPEVRWKENSSDVLLFAALRLPALEGWYSRQLLDLLKPEADPDPKRVASLMDALARLDGPLKQGEQGRLQRILARRVLEQGLGMGDIALAEALKLLDRRAPDWLPMGALKPTTLGASSAEGRLWIESLGKRGREGAMVRLQTLLAAQRLTPALLELASGPLPSGKAPEMATWSLLPQIQAGKLPPALGARPGSEALFLLDLGFHLLHPVAGGGAERWKPAYESFARLLIASQKRPVDTDPDLARALGKSLGRHLLKLPASPNGKRAGQWLGGWLAAPRTRVMGLAAAVLCLRERGHLLRDIDASMTGALPPLEAVMLRRRLLLASEGRPAELGQAPVDPEDPLLRWGGGR